MIVDTSAIFEIVTRQPGYRDYLDALSRASVRSMSAATLYEAAVVLYCHTKNDSILDDLRLLIAVLNITVVPFDTQSAWRAVDAYTRYGKGIHPAKLNLLDCVAYQLAREFSQPLLYKGADFAHTDIAEAV